jgi:hypothetical protein
MGGCPRIQTAVATKASAMATNQSLSGFAPDAQSTGTRPGYIRYLFDRRKWAAPVAFLLIFVAGWLVLRRHDLLDDAYITAHYSHNIALGRGWVWNVGTRPTNGATAPLWTVILAIIIRLDVPLVSGAIGLDALFYAAAAGCACALAARLAGWLGFAICSFWVLAFCDLLVGSTGMETPLYVLIVTASVLLWDRGNNKAAIGLAGILPVVRGDGCLLLIVLALVSVRSGRFRELLPWFALAILPAVVWEGFS